MTVTVQVAVAHGILPGQTYALSGFMPTGYNATYTAMSGTAGTTLVGSTTTGGGTCPGTVRAEGSALSGSGGAVTLTPISTSNPYGTSQGTGITTQLGDHFCGVVGEYGADSPIPGFQFAAFTDRAGNSLANSPAVVPVPNMGAVSFTGYTVVNTQSPSSPALTVTSMPTYTVTGATYSGMTGYVTFTTSGATPFIPGSEFTVTGVSPAGYNATYIAVAGTSGTTIVGNPLSGALGFPQAISAPSAYSSGGSMVGVIVPNMQILGASGPATILPYGNYSGTGTGGIGTYGLTSNQTTIGFSGYIAGTTLTIKTAPTGAQLLAAGETLNTTGGVASGTQITALLSGTGGVGSTYQVNISQTVGSSASPVAMQGIGALWASVTPGTIFAWSAFYFTGAPSAGAAGGAVTARTQASIGDFFNFIGGYNNLAPPQFSGWGGSLANVADFYGIIPTTSNQPSTTAISSLCKKTADFQSFATANSLTIHSLYRLNDPGIWGDSSNAVITGYITNASGTAATLNVISTINGSLALPAATQTAYLAGTGLLPFSPPSISLTTSAPLTYSITPNTTAALGSSGTPVTFSVGAYKPAAPVAQNGFNGYLSGSTLTVASIATANKATFTGTLTYPTNSFSGTIDSLGTGLGTSGNILDVTTAPTPANSIQIGSVITGTNIPAGTYIASFLTGGGSGSTGQYQLNNSTLVSSAEAITGVVASPVGSGVGSFLTPVNLMVASGTSPSKNMLITDGGTVLTGQPLFVNSAVGACGTNCVTVNPNYYPAITGAETMYGSSTLLAPGMYLSGNTSLTTPVKIISGTPTACATGEWGCGTYTVLNPGSLTIGSSGSPAAFNASGPTDGGAVAPGPALSISDPGPGITFPVTNSGSNTGTLWLSGSFDTSVLGGTPSILQAQVSYTAGGPPIAGCAACAWTNLSSYSTTLSSGTVFNWKGQVPNIPGGGPYYVSVRAANGIAYATLPSPIKVGLVFDVWGVGQVQPVLNGLNGGCYFSVGPGTWGQIFPGGGSFYFYDTGPAIVGNLYPTQTQMVAGDQTLINGACTAPLSEGSWALSTELQATMGLPTSIMNWTRDGAGFGLFAYGNTFQTQTVGMGNGTTTSWCSTTRYCSTAGVSGALTWNLAGQTGGGLIGSISGTTLAVSNLYTGALMPGLVLNDNVPGGTNSITGSPTLVQCLTGCSGVNGTGSTWQISASLTISREAMRADPVGGALTPYDNPQTGGTGLPLITQKANQIIRAGTFSITVNGTTVCTDSNTAVYNVMGGNCAGAGISSSFVNYVTGDYQVTFTSAPANGAVITASWTEIVSTDDVGSTNVFNQIDFTGDGTTRGGFLSNVYSRAPGGSSGHIFAACFDGGDIYNSGFPMGAQGLIQRLQSFYSVKVPALFPDMAASTPFINVGDWRGDGPLYYQPVNTRNIALNALCDEWANDSTTQSNFSGAISGAAGAGPYTAILTLSATTTTPMWEGEIIGCATFSVGCAVTPGTYISGLASGVWGASGSTYNLANNGSVAIANTGTLALTNAVYYSAGPAIYAGPMHDNSTSTPSGGPFGTDGFTAHPAYGWTSSRRIASRWAAEIYGGLTTSSNAFEPTLDRALGDYSGCDLSATTGPCFDTGNTFAASLSATWTGSVATVNGGLAAHARPFVVGQAFTCSGCNANLVITSIDVPPTQSTVAGLGEVGQTFHITTNAAIGGSGSGTIAAGCSGTAGPGGGSNCINFVFKINTTGTYGTAAALTTCGENNMAGYSGSSQPWYTLPNGICSGRGIGSLVRGFRIGTVQSMNGGSAANTNGTTGSPYDDGIDPYGGAANQSAAFSCNIVAPQEVQCVLGAAYNQTTHIYSGVGKWSVGSTYVSYGDTPAATERYASLMGNVGGQPFTITPGSGYTNGTYTISMTNCSLAGGTFVVPKVDVTVAGGSIVNAYVSTAAGALGYGIGLGCTVPLTALGGGSGGAVSMPVWPNDGSYGIAAYNNSINMTGDWLYDNSGFPGNPLNTFFTNGRGGYFEPGLPVRPFGEFMGVAVNG